MFRVSSDDFTKLPEEALRVSSADFTKHDYLVLVLNNTPINYYINVKILQTSDKMAFIAQPFFIVREAIQLLDITNIYYMHNNKYHKNIKIQVYSSKPIKYLQQFNPDESTIVYDFEIDFERLFTEGNYTRGEFTYSIENGIKVYKNNKIYVDLYTSAFLSSPNDSYGIISIIDLY